MREKIGIPMNSQERVEYERELADLRARMNEKAFALLWAEGRALSMEAAIDYAVVSDSEARPF